MFQEVLPGSKCYKLETLVQECSSLMYKAHSALEDVQALQSLVVHLKISSATLLKIVLVYSMLCLLYITKTNECLESLQPLSNTVQITC